MAKYYIEDEELRFLPSDNPDFRSRFVEAFGMARFAKKIIALALDELPETQIGVGLPDAEQEDYVYDIYYSTFESLEIQSESTAFFLRDGFDHRGVCILPIKFALTMVCQFNDLLEKLLHYANLETPEGGTVLLALIRESDNSPEAISSLIEMLSDFRSLYRELGMTGIFNVFEYKEAEDEDSEEPDQEDSSEFDDDDDDDFDDDPSVIRFPRK